MAEQIDAAQKLVNTLIEFSVNYSFQVLGAIIILVVGVILGKWIGNFVQALCTKRNFDITLSKFLGSITRLTVVAFAVVIALGKFGITIAPFVAAIGAAVFGATYAIQGPLSNYGAGLSIILGHPFVVGDTITVVGVSGVVQEVTLSSTILRTEDGVAVTIPNKHIVGEVLHNSKGTSIVEAVIGISYDSDPDRAIETIKKTLGQFEEIRKDPSPQVGIQTFADSSVNISFRYWVPTLKYFQTLYAVNLAVYKALQTADIKIPFPQRDVRIVSQPSNV